MRAVLQETYGPPDGVRVDDVPEPTPSDGEVLLEVRAVSLNGSDRENLAGRPLYARVAGVRRPRNPIPGSDVAGVVLAVGSAVSGFAPGDEVFGELPGYRGGLAERVAASPRTLAVRPADLSFVVASTIPQAGSIAWQALDGVTAGDHVLVNGAGGAGGVFVVGLARHLGAEVTAVDLGRKADHLRDLDADHTVAADEEDWASHRDRYDRIVDLVAHRAPWRNRPPLPSHGSRPARTAARSSSRSADPRRRPRRVAQVRRGRPRPRRSPRGPRPR